MNAHRVKVEDLRSGMMLWSWTREARENQGRYQHLNEGPEGCWSSMVIANSVEDPRNCEGFGYPTVHKIDVFFWNETGAVRFDSFYWTAGTGIVVIDMKEETP